ncbi:zinc finger CCCH domain-containing protein 10 [Bombina bombina]|uniref:zinc finger CCCH domain-containing protein 10 n=1 Tax=Bombina bombina TaxID=8345 RepID=UPI00235B0C1B|nr:zinc finger CCCH domain-containing protein 10 [Bombina bombina]XP_053564087.1 zinc finger CCCH domain-containing protein 10 [Bombina bombina]
MPNRENYANGASGSGSDESAASAEYVCRDYLRNVCKRGKRCRFKHPDSGEVSDLGVQKNEFVFCHDFQNKECVRINCRFIHGTKEDEEHYKKTGELPPRLRQKVAVGLGLSPTDLSNKDEVPICRDFLKGDCQRGDRCKFRHLQREYDYPQYEYPTDMRGGLLSAGFASGSLVPASARPFESFGPYDNPPDASYYSSPYGRFGERYGERYGDRFAERFDDPVMKKRRVGYEGFYTASPVEYRLLEEENVMLRRRVEDLKKQLSVLAATNEVLLDQNAQFRSQAKVVTLSTLSTTAPTSEQAVGAVNNYNHGIAQTHTTLSSQALQSRAVTQQELVASSGAPSAAQTNAAPQLNPEITPLSAALAQTIAQGMAPPPVSMAPVAVSVAPVAVSMAQPLPGITMSHATTPMVTYPIASQSMRITAMPH